MRNIKLLVVVITAASVLASCASSRCDCPKFSKGKQAGQLIKENKSS